MKAPPFLIGTALLFWGWQTGMGLAAAVLAIVLESARFVSWRLLISDKAFSRIADFSTLLQLLLVAYQFTFGYFPQALFLIFQWLPLLFFPLMCVQQYRTDNRIKLGALFITLRAGAAGQRSIRMDPFYLTACLLGAAAANVQTLWFYALLSLLLAWVLWSIRSARYSLLLWYAVMLLAIAIGYAGQIGLSRLQSQVQESMTDWLADFFNPETDSYQSSTHIGKLGMLKLSDRIELRVRPMDGQLPTLLREASYNTYVSGTWLARPHQFSLIKPDSDSASWTLNAASSSIHSVEISFYSKREKSVLALPLGTTHIAHLPAEGVEINSFASTKAKGIAGLVVYQAQFSPTAAWDAPPSKDDLKIPGNLLEVLSSITTQLNLEAHTPKQTLTQIEKFFADNFKYTLFLGDNTTRPKTLKIFLSSSRSGHCEYFATATVLLLRKAGIPARYATGYSVQEFNPSQGLYLVRSRHAHAWALAYIDGNWREIDTTPATWVSSEESHQSMLQPLYDLGSWLTYQFALWRMSETKQRDYRIYVLPGVLLLALLAWRLRKIHKLMPKHEKIAENNPCPLLGVDSPFHQVIEYLNRGEASREDKETLTQWIYRIIADNEEKQHLQQLLKLHYSYRFDPAGISEAEKDKLETLVNKWLQQKTTALNLASQR